MGERTDGSKRFERFEKGERGQEARDGKGGGEDALQEQVSNFTRRLAADVFPKVVVGEACEMLDSTYGNAVRGVRIPENAGEWCGFLVPGPLIAGIGVGVEMRVDRGRHCCGGFAEVVARAKEILTNFEENELGDFGQARRAQPRVRKLKITLGDQLSLFN